MRADKYFAEKFGSRTKAAQAIREGLVLLDGKPISPDREISGGENFGFRAREEEFVSNGGYKLARGLSAFSLEISGKVFADLGASTGGFTHCLLSRGAAHVFCVDVGKSQLSPELSSDKRVTVMDETNARYLTAEDFPRPLDCVVADLSFISLRLVLPSIFSILPAGGFAVLLFKPQFECGRAALGKNGLCPPRLHGGLLSDFYDFALAAGLSPVDAVNAPIREKKNIEYVLCLKKGVPPCEKGEFLRRAAPQPDGEKKFLGNF